jgi:hypothetical protein
MTRTRTLCKTPLVFATIVCLSLLSFGELASAATLDRAAAEADTEAAMTDGHYTFCSSPSRPLSPRAIRMCPLAAEISSCDGFVKACAELKPSKPESSWWSAGLTAFLGYVAIVLAALGILGALIGVGVAIARFVRSKSEDEAVREPSPLAVAVNVLEPAAAQARVDAESLLRAAADLSARGHFDQAIFTYLGASLRALDERGAIHIAQHRTHGEYVRACRDLAAKPALREIALDVDRVRFGGEVATAELVESTRARATGIVRSQPRAEALGPARIATMLLFMLSLGACGQSGLFGPGADPAGDDLLLDLLVREGSKVSHMTGALASLPMNGAEGPAVIVDTTKTHLDEETSAHLLAWVAQGGVLVVAGDPDEWPKDLWAKSEPAGSSREARVVTPCPPDDDACAPPRIDHIRLAAPAAMSWPHQGALSSSAMLESGELYAAVRPYQGGKVLGLASNDLLTNAGLRIRGNPSSLVALLESLDKTEFMVTRAENGVAPPTNPFAGLVRIGLGLGLLHVLFFTTLLFLHVGTRHARPIPAAPPLRRAFSEHVRATGALYARVHATGHALHAFADYVDRELRARAPRGTGPAQFLAQRADANPQATAELYSRAMAVRSDDPPDGEHLALLRRLSALVSKALSTS